jgi:hypothetical protein
VLVLHDTTEFIYEREQSEKKIGVIGSMEHKERS